MSPVVPRNLGSLVFGLCSIHFSCSTGKADSNQENFAEIPAFNLYGKICRCRTDCTDIVYFCVPQPRVLIHPLPPRSVPIFCFCFTEKFSFYCAMSLADLYYEHYTEAFCYSLAIPNICIFSWSHTQKQPCCPGLRSAFQTRAASTGDSHPRSQIILFISDLSSFLGFALCDLASKCMRSDATLKALATDTVNLLWHRVRAFLCGWIITYIPTKPRQLPVWPLPSFDGCQEN